jgi:hypothetical protein
MHTLCNFMYMSTWKSHQLLSLIIRILKTEKLQQWDNGVRVIYQLSPFFAPHSVLLLTVTYNYN